MMNLMLWNKLTFKAQVPRYNTSLGRQYQVIRPKRDPEIHCFPVSNDSMVCHTKYQPSLYFVYHVITSQFYSETDHQDDCHHKTFYSLR